MILSLIVCFQVTCFNSATIVKMDYVQTRNVCLISFLPNLAGSGIYYLKYNTAVIRGTCKDVARDINKKIRDGSHE